MSRRAALTSGRRRRFTGSCATWQGRGTVILMISSDMEEILNVSDRVAVMHEGEITGVLERADCTEENVMQLAVGKKIPAAKPAFEN